MKTNSKKKTCLKCRKPALSEMYHINSHSPAFKVSQCCKAGFVEDEEDFAEVVTELF